MNRDEFLHSVQDTHPELLAEVDEIDAGLLHLETASIRRQIERAIDDQRWWKAEQYCRHLTHCLAEADAILDNAIMISFVEDFALGDYSDLRQRFVRERMPSTMRELIVNRNRVWA